VRCRRDWGKCDLLEVVFREILAVIVRRQLRRLATEKDGWRGGIEDECRKLEELIGRLPEALGLSVSPAHDREKWAVACGGCTLCVEVDAAGISSGLYNELPGAFMISNGSPGS